MPVTRTMLVSRRLTKTEIKRQKDAERKAAHERAFRQIFLIMLKRGEPNSTIVEATNHALNTLKKHCPSTFQDDGYVSVPSYCGAGVDPLAAEVAE